MPKPTTSCPLCGQISAPNSDYCHECKQMDDRIRELIVSGCSQLPLFLTIQLRVAETVLEVRKEIKKTKP